MTEKTETTEAAEPLTAADFGSERRREKAQIRFAGKLRTVWMESQTETELAEWDSELLNEDGKLDPERQKWQRSKLLSRILCDENGKKLFDSPNGWRVIAASDGALTSKLYRRAVRFLGIRDSDEDAEKN